MRPELDIPSLLDVYTRPYDDKMLEWRRLGAIDKVSNIVEILGQRSSSIQSVLEVGAGTGQVLSLLAQNQIGNKHVGIEIGDTRLNYAISQPGISFQYYDGKRIPFPDKSFDFVYATHVLEHAVYERELLHEISRVAKELVYIEVPLEIHLRTSWAALNKTLQIGHINAYNQHSFLLKLETSGLSVIESKMFDHSPEILGFTRSPLKAFALRWLRRAGSIGNVGANIMSYHCGALCKPATKLDIS